MIDLTQTIRQGMPVFTGDPEVHIEPHLFLERDGCRVSRWAMGSHTGTHMDAPAHFIAGGLTLDQYPIDRFCGRGHLVDVTHLRENGIIGRELIEPAMEHIRPGEFLVVRTGWDRCWGSVRYDRHPYLTMESAQFMVEKGISLVAIDTPDIEKAPDGLYPVHRLLLGHDCLIVENLCWLDKIPVQTGVYSFIPLKVEGADGSPVRAFFHPER